MVEFLRTIFVTFFAHILPCWMVMAYENGVWFRWGKFHRVVREGTHLKWPIMDYIKDVDMREYAIDMRAQSLTTSDAIAVAVSVTTRLRVSNPKAHTLKLFDGDGSIETETLRLVGAYVGTHTFDECRDSAAFSKALEGSLKNELQRSWGVEIIKAGISDFVKARTMRLLGIDQITISQGETV